MAKAMWKKGFAGILGALLVLLVQLGAQQLSVSLDLGLVSGSLALAAEKAPPEKTRKTPALRSEVYEQLAEAQELAEAGKTGEALRILDQLRDSQGRRALNSYELANMYNFYAFVYYQKEQYARTIDAYQKLLQQPDIPVAMETSAYYSLAQLYFVTENYSQAIRYLKDWFNMAENPQPDAYVLLAQAYYQTKQYDPALRNIEKAMALARQKGKQPRENWFLLQRVLYYDKGDMKKVAQVLEELLRRWPKKEYWTQASGIYGELKNEGRQLVALETAYVAGMLSREQELLNMAYLYLGSDTPYRAAKVLEKALAKKQIAATSKNYELLGNALRSSQELERAIPAMAKAAELADSGELWARLANVYLDSDNFAGAADAARIALRKGQLRRPDSARIVLGMALFNLDKLPEARQQFERAAQDQRSEKMARDWIKYLDNEVQRRESLQDGLG